MSGLLRGEITLTVDIIAGLIIAELILKLRLLDVIMRKFLPSNIPAVTALSVALSAASSKAGAALLSSSLSRGEISESLAVWSVLMLPLPSYLRRWPATFALSVGMAGTAGGIFAVSLLLRSIVRFLFALFMVRREGCGDSGHHDMKELSQRSGLWRRIVRTLPFAWVMFAVSYSIVPVADEFFRENFAGSFLPVSGWAVSAASIGHISGALSVAGGAIAAGKLTASQAVFALILGSGLGTVTRILRQNAGYYYGLFPKSVATRMLVMNFATILPLIMVNLLFAGLALSLWP